MSREHINTVGGALHDSHGSSLLSKADRTAPPRVFKAHADPLLRSYRAIEPIISSVATIAAREAPDLTTYYAQAIRNVMEGERKGHRSSILEANDPALLLRRLSRESIGLAHDVDGSARFLVAAQSQCPSFRGPWRIEVSDLAHFDRPSLRLLARLAVLCDHGSIEVVATKSGQASVDANAGYSEQTSPALPQVLADSYRSLLGYIARLWNIPPLFDEDPLAISGAIEAGADFDRSAWMEAFRLQNYERAHVLLSCPVLGDTASAEMVKRTLVISLILANLGDAITPIELLSDLLSGTHDSGRRASLHYMLGLIKTKRTSRLDEAERHFRDGLEIVNDGDSSAPTILERGWLLNGLALLKTLQAKSKNAPDSFGEMLLLLQSQAEILALSLLHETPEFRYLHFNVLANTTLLLEGMGRYSEALEFWCRVFADKYRYGSRTDERVSGSVFFFYRAGVLALRAGNDLEAADMLRKALAYTDSSRTYLMRSYILYALGCSLEKSNCHQTADCFVRGAKCARDARDRSQSMLHTLALGFVAAKGGFGSAVAEVASKHETCFKEPVVLKRPQGLTMPPSKLPTYFPFIDLDPSPERDLNQIISA